MNRFLLAFIALAVLTSPAQAARRGWQSCPNCPPQYSQPQVLQPSAFRLSPLPASRPIPATQIKVDGASNYNAGRVADLPQGPERCYLTVSTSDNPTAQESALAEWFKSDPRLASMKEATHWNQYTASNPHFRDRLQRSYGMAFPIVTLQRDTGEILANITAHTMPRTAGALADLLEDAVRQHFGPPAIRGYENFTPIVRENGDCPDGQCPLPKPNPQPDRRPLIPDILPRRPLQEALSLARTVAVYGAVGLAVAAVVAAIYYYARNRRRARLRRQAGYLAGGVTAAAAAAWLAHHFLGRSAPTAATPPAPTPPAPLDPLK